MIMIKNTMTIVIIKINNRHYKDSNIDDKNDDDNNDPNDNNSNYQQ